MSDITFSVVLCDGPDINITLNEDHDDIDVILSEDHDDINVIIGDDDSDINVTIGDDSDISVVLNENHSDINVTIGDTQAVMVTIQGGIGIHNTLPDLQGGAADEYYHLLEAEYKELSEWLDNVTLGSDGLITIPELVLTPRTTAMKDVLGGMYFCSIDKGVYVCTSI